MYANAGERVPKALRHALVGTYTSTSKTNPQHQPPTHTRDGGWAIVPLAPRAAGGGGGGGGGEQGGVVQGARQEGRAVEGDEGNKHRLPLTTGGSVGLTIAPPLRPVNDTDTPSSQAVSLLPPGAGTREAVLIAGRVAGDGTGVGEVRGGSLEAGGGKKVLARLEDQVDGPVKGGLVLSGREDKWDPLFDVNPLKVSSAALA
jgi:hypothetical protein